MQRIRKWGRKLALASHAAATKRYGKDANQLRGSFCVDSGATRTLLKKTKWLQRLLHRERLRVVDAVGKVHGSQGHGTLDVVAKDRHGAAAPLGGVGQGWIIRHLLFNLLSVSEMCNGGCEVVFRPSGRGGSFIRTNDGDILPLIEQGGLYFLPVEPRERRREGRARSRVHGTFGDVVWGRPARGRSNRRADPTGDGDVNAMLEATEAVVRHGAARGAGWGLAGAAATEAGVAGANEAARTQGERAAEREDSGARVSRDVAVPGAGWTPPSFWTGGCRMPCCWKSSPSAVRAR